MGSVSSLTLMAGAAMAQDQSAAEVGDVVVTGIRGGAPRTAIESPTPIDVFNAEQLSQGAQTGVFESIRYLVPSFNLPTRAGGGSATVIATGSLRGLNPDQTLVLVNGKRRHRTALINSVSTLYNGSVGVDLNMLPSSAISRVEVLRDGAAAQYGSDAVAGVINVILNKSAEGGQISVSHGQNFDRQDGKFVNVDADIGFALGENGFANLSYSYMDRGASNRAVPIADSVRLYPLVNGQPDPREKTIDRLVTTNYGQMPQESNVFGINAEYRLNPDVELYGFGTYGKRVSDLNWTFRPATDVLALPEIAPDGFRAQTVIKDEDYELVGGARGTLRGWDWDLSTSYGTNISDWENNSFNASLGPSSPRHFYIGQLRSAEWVNALDVTRGFELDNAGDLQVSFGLQHRRENYQIKQGDEASWIQGTYVRPVGQPGAGQILAPGSQSTPGFRPEDEADVSRNNYSVYGELGWNPNERLYLGAAVRYENFDDSAGDTTIYKLSGRYEFNDWFAVRASYNTGFRAPSLAQQAYSATTSQLRDVVGNGILVPLLLKNLQVNSPEAIALGAKPLTPELSKNLSAGFTLTPWRNFALTLDAYQIDVDDRIAVTSTFSPLDTRLSADGVTTIGKQIQNILVANGLSPEISGQYYTNAIDTRTRGVDLVVTYKLPTDSYGLFDFSLGYNHNKTEITGIVANPPQLAALGNIELFDRSKRAALTESLPKSKVSANANWSLGRVSANLRATRFDSFVTRNATNPAQDRNIDAEWIVDAQVNYDLNEQVRLSTGVNNLFNKYPTQVDAPSAALGTNQYSGLAPFGFTGGSWFVRVAYKW
ncbi:iron complex outermembrane receptor protein [Brevundimonas nasdae]|uniref:TonB-dependent receptor plug domain-containing protein n=1 Tax=Brevundimonas nasdae TaxID=172043 RepID=UPI0019128477|nr:TonB-dependent receptor [Brevundimonas nasdae]MBK6024343.1 TonB-dependent receptor [Brevundimonas nasdae]MDQ0451001.1 iron complex outermembrane receptor protein [Brevundimonas nasdae]